MNNYNNKKLKYLINIIIILFISVIFFGFYNELIIIRFPTKYTFNNTKITGQKKLIKIYIPDILNKYNNFNNIKFIKEELELVVSSNSLSETIKNILASWILLAAENYKFNKPVNIQNVSLDIDKQLAYISFDKNLFNKNSSIFNKLILIESLLKTLRENSINIKGIYFLVNHKTLQDMHLDFAQSWPLSGYLARY